MLEFVMITRHFNQYESSIFKFFYDLPAVYIYKHTLYTQKSTNRYRFKRNFWGYVHFKTGVAGIFVALLFDFLKLKNNLIAWTTIRLWSPFQANWHLRLSLFVLV